MKKISGLVFLFAVLLFGCKTDFEVNAPWKETVVIYGLLDQSGAVQMIKINKAFLGEGDANVFAQIPDSSNYDPRELSVVLSEIKNGTVLRNITFHDSIIAGKKPGDFSTTKNIIYVSYEKLDSTDFTKVYKLTVTNLKTGNIATANTPLLEKARFTKPTNNSPYISFSSIPSSPSTTGSYTDLVTTWNTKVNAKTYQTNVRFYYLEKDIASGAITEKYIDWLQSAKQSAEIDGGEVITQNISGQGFYQFIASEVAENSSVFRVADRLTFTMTVGADELNNYINVNSPSGDLNQDKPSYTNVENGYGVFSSRTSFFITKYLCNEDTTPSRTCDATVVSLKELVQGKFTYKLGFKYSF